MNRAVWIGAVVVVMILSGYINQPSAIQTVAAALLYGTASTTPSFLIQNNFSLTASFANDIYSNGSYQVPIGWGYMDPMIPTSGNDFYVPTFSPCSNSSIQGEMVYCMYVFKSGTTTPIVSKILMLGADNGDKPKASYQPPSLFGYGNQLIAGYWYINSNGVSSYALSSLNLAATNPVWKRLTTYRAPAGIVFNYNGAAMGRNGTIYISGWASGGTTNALWIIKSAPPYTSFVGPQKIVSYTTPSYHPLYPHLVIENDNKIEVFFDLANGNKCPQYGSSLTAYKIATLYEGYWGQTFKEVWSDAPADSIASSSTNGSNCNWNASRFPLDLIYSPSNNSTYTIERVSDVPIEDPAAKSVPAGPVTQKFVLHKNATVLYADLGTVFSPIFSSSNDIDSMSLTQLADGTFAIFANSRSTLGPFAVVLTKDFQTFSSAQSIDAPYGVGDSVKVAQGYKNTIGAINQIVFYHSGRLNDAWTDLPNYHLQFSGGVGVDTAQ